jgi:small neutral amino acid transporter SnatA (MarC family)
MPPEIAPDTGYFSIVFQLLIRHSESRTAGRETATHRRRYAAIPLMAGPGAITASVLLAGRAGGGDPMHLGVLLAALAAQFVIDGAPLPLGSPRFTSPGMPGSCRRPAPRR